MYEQHGRNRAGVSLIWGDTEEGGEREREREREIESEGEREMRKDDPGRPTPKSKLRRDKLMLEKG